MPVFETNTRKLLERLRAGGWVVEGGTKHTKLAHPGKPWIKIILPRHREQSPGVARAVARDAGWI